MSGGNVTMRDHADMILDTNRVRILELFILISLKIFYSILNMLFIYIKQNYLCTVWFDLLNKIIDIDIDLFKSIKLCLAYQQTCSSVSGFKDVFENCLTVVCIRIMLNGVYK